MTIIMTSKPRTARNVPPGRGEHSARQFGQPGNEDCALAWAVQACGWILIGLIVEAAHFILFLTTMVTWLNTHEYH